MAGHFQSVLAASDLSECSLYPLWKSHLISTVSPVARFVPFAIFVCSASMFIILVLLVDLDIFEPFSDSSISLVFSFFLRDRNPISTRIELASLCLAGIFWLGMFAYGDNEYSCSTLSQS